MRTRKEIEEEYFGKRKEPSLEGDIALATGLSVEVLLDIRDLLEEANKVEITGTPINLNKEK